MTTREFLAWNKARPENMGKATYKKGVLYFDAVGWAMLKRVANKTHKRPQQIVIAALKRLVRRQNG